MLPPRILSIAADLRAVAAPARATWTASGKVDVAGVPTAIEAEVIEPDDVVVNLRIGTAGSSAAEGGVATVPQETNNERRSLGRWDIDNGTGNVQATFGAADAFNVGSGTSD